MKINCIIAARSGSKRIPNKNILKINGKPMIAHTIYNAKNSNIFKNIYVTTDSLKIKKNIRVLCNCKSPKTKIKKTLQR